MGEILMGIAAAELINAIYSKMTKKNYELIVIHLVRSGVKSYNNFVDAIMVCNVINSINECEYDVIDENYKEVL